MSRGIGRIQKKILEILRNVDDKWYSPKDKDQRWVSLHIVIIMLYHPEQLDGSKGYLDWSYGVNEHRRVWESVKSLEKRGRLETRIRRREEVEGRIGKTWGGIQKWMEVRVK